MMTHTERGRGGVRESLSRHKDPSVFAAASNIDNASLIDLLAVKRGHSLMCFDASVSHAVKLFRQSSSSLRVSQCTGRQLVNKNCGNA